MALLEFDPVRAQAANRIRELRAEGLMRLNQVQAVMAAIRDVQAGMLGNPSFADADLAEVDAVVDELQAAVRDHGAQAVPAKPSPVPAPVEIAPAEVVPAQG